MLEYWEIYSILRTNGKSSLKFTCDVYITNWYYSNKSGIIFAMYQRMISKGTSWARTCRPYLVLKSTPRVPGDRPIMSIGYKFISRKVLGFIVTEGSGSNEPGDPYLSHLPDIYSNFYVCPVVCPNLLGRYLNSCNTIVNKNRMRQYDLEL